MRAATVRERLLTARCAGCCGGRKAPVPVSYGPETEVPHLQHLKEMARIGALQTVLDAEEGRSGEWPEDVEFQLKIAATLDGEPMVLSHLVRNGILRMAARATERSLNQVSPSDAACQKLQAAFVQAGKTNSLPLALIGERAM